MEQTEKSDDKNCCGTISSLTGIIIILAVTAIISGGIYWWQQSKEKNKGQNINAEPQVASFISAELARLNIKTVGRPKKTEFLLPEILSDADWGLKKDICRQGGYNLSPYAGQSVWLISYPIEEKYREEALDVWIIISQSRIACVYKSARDGSNLAPGIFPAQSF
jgi:hypothetical protein